MDSEFSVWMRLWQKKARKEKVEGKAQLHGKGIEKILSMGIEYERLS